MLMKQQKSIDLFAGIGGIRLGFEQAFGKSLKTVFVSEWDDYAQATYKTNYPDKLKIAGDITKIDENDVPDFDICLAGFPCQAFILARQCKETAFSILLNKSAINYIFQLLKFIALRSNSYA
jgi:DNA (cytosine-5)-methyltransferase 1